MIKFCNLPCSGFVSWPNNVLYGSVPPPPHYTTGSVWDYIIVFSCHVSLVVFTLENFHSRFLPFQSWHIWRIQCAFFPLLISLQFYYVLHIFLKGKIIRPLTLNSKYVRNYWLNVNLVAKAPGCLFFFNRTFLILDLS